MDFNKKMKLAKRLIIANWVFIALQIAALTLGIIFACKDDMPTATLTLVAHFAVFFVFNFVMGWIEEYGFLRVMYPDCYNKSGPSHWTIRLTNNYKAAKMCGDAVTCTLILQQGMRFGMLISSVLVNGIMLVS